MIWREPSTPGPTTTTLLATPTTTTESTTTVAVTTSTSAATTTTSEEERIAEVEQILTDLWFGWFDAIYERNSDDLWNVVATTRQHEAGIAAMDNLSFVSAPSVEGLDVQVNEVLLDRNDCLVVHQTLTALTLEGSPSVETVEVMWPDPRYGWRFATSWAHPEDLWKADCDEVVREETP
jgi:hypothetical protein